MEDNKTRVLYDRLTQDGYDIGDFDSFSKNVQDETKRKSLYETITNDGYDVGDFDSFSSKLVARSQEEPVTNVTTQNVQPEQPQAQPVQDMPSYDPKTQGYILDNVPDMFRSKGNNLATRPLPQQDLFENNPSDLVRKIGIDQQQRVEQAQKSANDPYMKEQNLELFKRQNQEQINSVNELINAARQERAKERQQRVRSVGDGGIFSTMSQAYLAGEQNDTDKQLEYATTLMEQAQNITNEAKKKGNTNFFASFARGFKDAPLDGWAMGLQDLKNYSAVKKVMDKVDKGEELTPSEDALMQALVTNAATQMYYAGDLGRGYKAGGVTAESLPFMLDMIAGMGAVQALTKPASKAIVKYAADKAAQMGLGRATTGLAKGAARTVAGLGDVAAHTATFGSARVAADYQRRGLGDVQVKPNADRTVSYDGRENVQTGAEALGKSIISTAAETGSELLGEYFAPMLGYIGRVTGANKVGKIIPASVGKAFKDVVNSQGFREMQEISRRAKISDPLGEYAEEVANNLVSTAIGDMTPEQLVDLDQNIDTFLGVAPMSALFGAAGTGGYLRDKYKNYRNMRNFETQMQDAMGEDWSGVREALQDADIETARNMVKDVLSSPMSPDMKKNAIKYISSVLQEQTLQEADKQMMPEEIAVEKRNIINNLNETRSKISLNDEELNAIINSEEGYQAIISQFDPETANNIMKYKQAYDDFVNYNYWVQDQADNARRQAEAQVESLTNATTGTIMRVNSGLSTNPVNILRGNLVFDNEGKVDENQSDKTIYYMSEDGRVKMAPVSMFSSLVDNTPAEEMIQRAGNDAQEEVLQAEEAQINSIPAQEQQPIGPETRFTMGGNNYEVNRVTPDGYEVYLLDENGTPAQSQLMSEEEIRNAINGQQPANAEETQPSVTEQPVQEETSEQPVQENQTAMSRIPLNERGEQDFEAAPVADTSAALLEISDNVDDAKDTATQMIDHYNNELKKAEKAKSTGNTIQEIVKMKQEKKANIKAINDKISYWNQVAADLEAKRPTGLIAQAEEKAKENQQRLASMTAEEQQAAQQEVQKKIDAGAFERKEPRKKVRYVKEDADLGPSITPQEHVLREIATGRVSFSLSDTEGAQGLSSHLGYSNSPEERKKLVWALSSDGLTPEAAAEQIHADMPENLQGMVTDQDVFNMIINAFQEYGSPSKMWDAAKNMHGTDIEENIPRYEEDQERQLIEWEASENRMSVPEWIAYSDYIEEELNNLYSSVTDEELNTIFEQIINDYERRAETESAGSTKGQTDSKQGNTVQPERESDNEGRTGEVEEQPEPANKTDGESGNVVPEPGSEVTREKETYDGALNNGNNSVSSQNNLNGREHEQGEVAGVSGESGSLDGKNEAEAYLRRAGDRTTAEDGQSRWTRNTLLRDVVQRNKGHQTWIDDIQSIINGERVGLGGENDVYLSRDGKSVVKINDFSYLPGNSTNFDSFMNRVDAHNELFPHDAITILGFTLNSDDKVSVVLSQPYISNAREATQEEIDNFLEEMGFYTDMSGNWTDGTYEIADTKPNNVLVDEDGNLHFIDVIPYDSRKPGKMLEIPAKRNAFVAPDIKNGEDMLDYIHRVAKAKEINDAERETDINPTEAQKEAGNYKKGHIKIDGYDITIENPKGSVRSGKDADGNEWSVTMNNDYGYIRGTRGVDGDHIDIFLSDNPESGNVYVIDQVDQQTGMYDESKVMYGFNSIDEAKNAYLSNYEEGWKVGVISEVSRDEFKKWIESSTNKIKPFSEYKNVDVISAENDGSAKNIDPVNEETSSDEVRIVSPNMLPKKLRKAYESGNEKDISNTEKELMNFIESTDDIKMIYNTYFYSKDLLGKKDILSPSGKKMHSFIVESCKKVLEKKGIPSQALSNEKSRIKVAERTDNASVLGMMSYDNSQDVVRSVINNPNTSESILRQIIERFSNNGLDFEAKQVLDKRKEASNTQSKENIVPISKIETTTNEEKLINQNKENKKTTESKFLSESEYIKQKVDEDFKNSGIEDRQEWDESDESIDSFNKASDEYPDYISNLSDSGELQRIYDQSNIGEKIKIRESVEAAGYEINELIDTSKEKSAAKKKRNRKREARSKELMEKIGIKSDDVRFRETDVNFSDFAKNHNLNEADVKKYAQSMRNGNLGGASYAFKSIHRSVRLQNDNLSLGQFVKVFSPIKKELYDTFGNLDSLREEYVQREIEERNMMEAAKKRIEEEKKAENERLLEFENMSDQEMDEAYFKALENNDKSRMRDIVNESARRKGYMSTGEFRMSHRAPSYDEEGIDKSMIDVANNKDNIRDSLNEQMRMNQDKNRKESVNAINNALSSIEKDGKAMVTIYRAVPKSIKESNVRNGDWVTLSESYAKQHGNHALEGNYRIIKEEVPAENLYWDGNDINEWGYDDRNDYRYKDTKNNRKLNDLVTRDDNGNIIPPSKRFNSKKKDTRYRFIGEQGAANLDAAEEANTRLDNLVVAREMEKSGKDAKSIKIATGWERGADNKWRYETKDIEYVPDGSARKLSLFDNKEWKKELDKLSNKMLDGEVLSDEENKRFDELSTKYDEVIEQLNNTEKLYLDDYVKDDELFKAYPKLKQTKIVFVDKNNGEAGSYSHKDNTITVNLNSRIEVNSILAHEIQHAIQHMERFSTGGNYKSVLLFFEENPEVEIKFVVDETYKEAKNRGIDITKEELHKMFTESDDVAQDIENKIIDRNNITEAELGEVYNSGVDAGYRSISGEVEARNVQSRLNMTPEERRKTLASETEDVAREDQIFLYDSMGVNSMTIDENQDLNNIKSKDVEETSKKLNVPVEVITSVDQIKDSSVRSAIEKGRKVKGWYSLKDNKVYVYLPNATSMEDVNQTILHEGVAHYGLRQLVGEDRMDDFLDDVFANVTDEVRKKIIDTLPRYGYNSRIATEEYMARMAENGVDISVWQRIKQAFNSLMRRMGINIKISDNELRYILWRSRQNLDKNKPLDLAKDVAMQYQMGVGNYFREDTDGSIGMYEQSLKGWKYKAQEAYQDSMLALKNLQEVIAKVSGKPIKSFENAYMAENQLSSKNTSEAEVYYKKHYQPMLQEAGKMMKKYGLTQKGIERYMMLAHGIERNVELTFRGQLDEVIKNNPDDADQFIQDFKDEKERLRKLYSGYEYLKELSDYIGGVNDYSATQAILNSMDGEKHDNFQEDALNYVKDFEQTYDVKELWNKTNDATKTTLRKAYDSGMMGKEQYSNVNNMYMYYVPLRGWDEQTAEDVYGYIDSERNPVSSVLKSAKGRKSIPDEIFATIGNMAESAIMQGNRNMMKQSFMSMVINHPTDIATLKKAWYVYDPVKDEWNISMPDIQESDNAETIAEKLKNHEEQMKQLKENGLATQKPNGLNINYRINKNNISQHVVQVKNGGKDYVIYINGNPRAAQAINGLTNPNVEQNPIFRSIATANRWLAANFTTRNPAFVLSNLVRDLIFSNVAVSIKEDGKYSSRFRKNILKAMPVVLRNLNGKPNNTEADRYFQEFIENGGETGYMHLNDVEKYKKKVRKELSKINGEMGSAKMAMDFAIDRLEDFNRWAEDISRFTTYMTSRQMGRSITESVNDAKEVTVNFNKKGAGYKTGGFFGMTSGIFRNLYLFFNASVQSLTNFKRLYDKQPVKFYSALGGFMSAGFLMPMINNVLYSIFGGGDDDPYNDLPEWVRRNNLCIYTGNDTFLTIPLPIELRAFYGLGDYAYQLTTGKEKPSATNIAKGTVGQLADLLPLNPTGNEGLKTFMPDIMSPIFEAYVWNKDFTGKPVAKISPFNERDPEWKRVYKGTSGWLVDTSKFLNDISNGSGPGSEFRKGFIDFNPAKVEHLLESYFGGMAKTFNQAGKTIYYGGKSLIEQQKDEDLVMRNVPIVNRFLNTVDERNAFSGINTEYFNLRDEMNQFKYELNGVKKSGNKDEYKEMLNSDLYDKYQKYKPYQKKLKKLNDMAKESQGEDRKEIEDMIIETRRELLEEVK